jgi:hypothetical protein
MNGTARTSAKTSTRTRIASLSKVAQHFGRGDLTEALCEHPLALHEQYARERDGDRPEGCLAEGKASRATISLCPRKNQAEKEATVPVSTKAQAGRLQSARKKVFTSLAERALATPQYGQKAP